MDGVVDEPVHDGVGQGGLGDVVVPLVEGQLGDDDPVRGSAGIC